MDLAKKWALICFVLSLFNQTSNDVFGFLLFCWHDFFMQRSTRWDVYINKILKENKTLNIHANYYRFLDVLCMHINIYMCVFMWYSLPALLYIWWIFHIYISLRVYLSLHKYVCVCLRGTHFNNILLTETFLYKSEKIFLGSCPFRMLYSCVAKYSPYSRPKIRSK